MKYCQCVIRILISFSSSIHGIKVTAKILSKISRLSELPKIVGNNAKDHFVVSIDEIQFSVSNNVTKFLYSVSCWRSLQQQSVPTHMDWTANLRPSLIGRPITRAEFQASMRFARIGTSLQCMEHTQGWTQTIRLDNCTFENCIANAFHNFFLVSSKTCKY